MKKIMILLVLFFGSTFPLQGQDKLPFGGSKSAIAKISLYLSQTTLSPKERLGFALEIKMTKGYHFYGHNVNDYDKYLIPTKLNLTLPKGIKLVKIIYGKPHLIQDPNLKKEIPMYEGIFIGYAILEGTKDLSPAKLKLSGVLNYQACDENNCFPPKEQKFSISFQAVKKGISPSKNLKFFQKNSAVMGLLEGVELAKIVHSSTTPKKIAQNDANEKESSFADIVNKYGLFVALLMALVWGLMSAVLPCVYPLIPVTISYFTAQSKGSTALRIAMGFFYMMGIALSFTILSLVATAILGKQAGSLLGNAYFVHGLFAFFLILALSMFGLFELRLPYFITDKLQSSQKGGLFGAFVMGGVLGMVAAPCVAGPFATILVFAVKKSLFVASLATFAYGIGLGAPFMALAIFSSSTRSIPKAGAWMERVKLIMGFMMIGVGVYFEAGSALISPETTSILYGILLLFSAVFLGGFDQLTGDTSLGMRWGKAMGLTLAILGGFLMFQGFYQPPRVQESLNSRGSKSTSSKISWIKDKKALENPAIFIQKKKKPLFVFFSAKWCTYCRTMKLTVFHDPEVIQYIQKNFIAVYADIDLTPGAQKLKNKLQIADLPGFAFYNKKGKLIQTCGKKKTANFLEILKKVQNSN